MRFWMVARVEAAETQPALIEWRKAQSKRKATRQANTQAAFDQWCNRVRESGWRDLLPEACETLFELNRFAKHERCEREQRDIIYKLKNAMIRLLYRNGYCTDCVKHTVEHDDLICFRCDGEGFDRDCDVCERCDGSGIFREGGTEIFAAFRFVVDGKTFAWHQRMEDVSPNVVVTGDGSTDWEPADEELPIIVNFTNEMVWRKRMILLQRVLKDSGTSARKKRKKMKVAVAT